MEFFFTSPIKKMLLCNFTELHILVYQKLNKNIEIKINGSMIQRKNVEIIQIDFIGLVECYKKIYFIYKWKEYEFLLSIRLIQYV